MKDEIKEILELNGDKYNVCLPKEVKEAFNCIDYALSVCNDELPKILNYITNLQERIEKAIDYIKHAQNYTKEKNVYVNGDDLLNILKGE